MMPSYAAIVAALKCRFQDEVMIDEALEAAYAIDVAPLEDRIAELNKWGPALTKQEAAALEQTIATQREEIERLEGLIHAELKQRTSKEVLLCEENARLDAEWKKTHDWNTQLVAEHYALKQQIAKATGYLTRLFHIVAPECKPMDTLLMLCTQIDNYIAGQNRQIAEQTAEIERLEAALRTQKDECDRFHKPA